VAAPDANRRSERSRRAILDATRALLGEVGYDRLAVEAIAARAGVGKQTIYRWWPSKGAVVFDTLLDGTTDATGDVSLPDTGDIARDLRTLLRAVVAEMNDEAMDALQRAVLAEVQRDHALADELVRRLLRPQIDATAQRLRVARDAGQLRPDADPDIGAELLYGPIFHRWLLRTGPLDEAYADALLTHVLMALGATSRR
jgi:AcrR family transcriptional regulator